MCSSSSVGPYLAASPRRPPGLPNAAGRERRRVGGVHWLCGITFSANIEARDTDEWRGAVVVAQTIIKQSSRNADMSFTDRVPGMRPGATARNLFVLILYLGFIWAWPLVAGYYVGRDRGGWAAKLSRLPGISDDGGVQSGLVVVIAGYLLITLLFAVPGADTDTAADGTDIESTSGGVDGQSNEPVSTDSGGTDPSSDSTDGSTTDTSSDSSDETTGDSTSDTADTSDSDNTVSVEVVDVVDGDTMEIEYENGTEDTVRLIGVDTPEVHVEVSPDEYEGIPDTQPARQCLNGYGDEASTFAEQEIGGDTVRLQFDELSDRRGSFDRLLVYIIDDGENFNHLLLDEGLARVYDSSFTESDRFYETETAERENQTGVWSCQNAGSGDDGSSGGDDGGSQTSDSALEIAEIHEDAAGDEYDNLNDEYITFRNTGDAALDLGGWTIEDDADHDYTVPTGFTLEAGEEVTLYTGEGEDTDTDLYWGLDNPVWNNGGDTVHVYNANGELVTERSYE